MVVKPNAEGSSVGLSLPGTRAELAASLAAIERGEADVIIAGGSDSTSNAEIKLPQKVVRALGPMMMGKGEKAPQKPWDGAEGLEWEVPSPAPFHTFETPPRLNAAANKVIG